MKRRTLTLVETVIVLLILLVLLSVGINRIISLSRDAQLASEQAIVRAVKAGIQIYYVESSLQDRTPLYPQDLDAAADGSYVSPTNLFFDRVLESVDLIEGAWYKISDSAYKSPTGKTYTYNNTTGVFSE